MFGRTREIKDFVKGGETAGLQKGDGKSGKWGESGTKMFPQKKVSMRSKMAKSMEISRGNRESAGDTSENIKENTVQPTALSRVVGQRNRVDIEGLTLRRGECTTHMSIFKRKTPGHKTS